MSSLKYLSVVAGLALAGSAFAQTAADNCADAPLVMGGTYDFDLSAATNDAAGVCGGTATAPDMWFKIAADVSGTLSAETCTISAFDTVLSIYDACGGTSLACNDDSCGLQSRVSVNANAGSTYWIRIARFGGGAGGAGQVLITAPTPPPPGTWVEQDDAGTLPSDAQAPSGSGDLNQIRGNLTAGDSDMYRIRICTASSFDASLQGGAGFDTQLFLFNTDGMGVAFNDDAFGLQSHLTAQFVTADGEYYIAISGYDNDPLDATGAALWIDTPFGVERAPDGPGAASPVASWSGGGASGAYIITFMGTCYPGGGGGCVADVDDGTGTGTPDGGVTIDDLLYYLVIYSDGNIAADVDNGTFTGTRDGGVTIDDLLYFLVRYADGC